MSTSDSDAHPDPGRPGEHRPPGEQAPSDGQAPPPGPQAPPGAHQEPGPPRSGPATGSAPATAGDAPAVQPVPAAASGGDFDPFRFGRPEPGSPAAAAFPHLFPPHGSGPELAHAEPAGPGVTAPPGAGWDAPQGGGWDASSGPGPHPIPGSVPQASPGPGWGAPAPHSYGYGYPPSGGNAEGSGNRKAVAGFVLGIAGLVLFFFTLFDLIPIVLSFVFSIQGLQASRRGKGHRGLALAGLVLASLATVAVVIFVAFVAVRVEHCQQHHDQGTQAYDQCVLHLATPVSSSP